MRQLKDIMNEASQFYRVIWHIHRTFVTPVLFKRIHNEKSEFSLYLSNSCIKIVGFVDCKGF